MDYQLPAGPRADRLRTIDPSADLTGELRLVRSLRRSPCKQAQAP